MTDIKNKRSWFWPPLRTGMGRFFLFVLLVLLPFSDQGTVAQTITVYAGTGTPGYSGDGGLATLAQFDRPRGVAIDRDGNLLIADFDNNCIRKVDSAGIITTLVGTGKSGYSGDGGLASQAELSSPPDVAVDTEGNIYIADMFNHCIRKVDSMGVITTIAGTGRQGFSGDGGAATLAQLHWPSQLCVDDFGNVYIADSENFRIRKVDSSGMISTVAGTGMRGYSGDGGSATHAMLSTGTVGVAVDTFGNLYITDRQNHRIRKVDSSGIISTIAGTGIPGYSGDGGPATLAQLRMPTAIFVDELGNLFITDRHNGCIRQIDTEGKIFTVAGPGPQLLGNRGTPARLALDPAGNIYFSQPSRHRIQMVSSLAGAYVIRQLGTDRYLGQNNDVLSHQELKKGDLNPQHLQFIWNLRTLGAMVTLENVKSSTFLHINDGRIGLATTSRDRFALMRSANESFFITRDKGTRKLIAGEGGEVVFMATEKEADAAKWELVRVGPIQKGRLDADEIVPRTLDGRQVVLESEGYMYRSNHEGYGTFESDYRRLGINNGWIAVSEPSLGYREHEVFVIEHVGQWQDILGGQNDYAQQCDTKFMNKAQDVYLLKTTDGVYLQPDGVTTPVSRRKGDPHRPIVHLSVGEQPGIHPVYAEETSEREKAALFVFEVDDDNGLYLSAVSHQWHQSLYLGNLGKFSPSWGIVAPINLYTLQACHAMHTAKPWPDEYDQPAEHWITPYPLGVSIPLDEGGLGYSKAHAGPDHFNTKVCFTNNPQKNRTYNPYLGITTKWHYRFDVHPNSQVEVHVLDSNGFTDNDERALLRRASGF